MSMNFNDYPPYTPHVLPTSVIENARGKKKKTRRLKRAEAGAATWGGRGGRLFDDVLRQL